MAEVRMYLVTVKAPNEGRATITRGYYAVQAMDPEGAESLLAFEREWLFREGWTLHSVVPYADATEYQQRHAFAL